MWARVAKARTAPSRGPAWVDQAIDVLEVDGDRARALIAVGHNHGLVEEIFLSPQGCDREFFAKVTDEGLMVTTADRPVRIAWPAVATLAETMSF